ncbi:IDEAL domain-containing protein [Priestia abyssalis]|uniref:IDEAL domain-containing protein n=1 Tax=Priestia abyssalis TaxID=1221450 RepID=UPI000994DFFC|nr:IDEAL domain-containing protein [Priestia abyssalis]
MKQYDDKSKTTNQMNVYQTLKTKFYEKETAALLDFLTYSFNKKHIQTLLDRALDQKDKEAFIHYSNLYNQLLKKEPSPS